MRCAHAQSSSDDILYLMQGTGARNSAQRRRCGVTKGRKSCPIPCATHKSPLCVRQDTNSKADPSCVQHMQYTSTDRAAECSTRLAVQREAAAATRDDMPRPGATCPCPPWASHRKASNRAHHTFNMQAVARR